MKKLLIQHIVKSHHLYEPLARELGKSKQAVQKQILRGNPGFDERMRLIEALEKLTHIQYNPIQLFSPVRKDQYHLFTQI